MADNQPEPGRKTDHSNSAHRHVPGAMDITQQEKTYAGFLRMVGWAVAIILGILAFLALANV